MAMSMHLDVVSAEAEIFSGRVERVFATGVLGDLEVAPGHAQLLTSLLPGPVRIRTLGGEEQVIYVTGGLFEVQPDVATILADIVIRAKDFNEAEVLKAKQDAEEALKDKGASIDHAKARAELVRAAGLLRAIHKLKEKVR